MRVAFYKFKTRWNAKESRVGRFLKIFIGYVFAICTAAGYALEYTHLVPEDWIPQWLKYSIAVMAFVGFIVGKLTKQKEPDGPQQDNS